tara:strand:+ start:3255 stop:3473 length:219 start_codon:yes stop_codon:yes gene_type:complete
MPKNKKPRKKHKPQEPKIIKKYPHCKVCGNETRLATQAELMDFKAHDPSMNMEFLFIPTCECWEKTDDWMVL